MNREPCIELSSSSSRESLGEEAAEQEIERGSCSAREIDWKKQQQQQGHEEIEISGSKAEEAAEEELQPAAQAASELPKTESVQRRLKSATLDRMGKMLKIHSKSSGEKPDAAMSASAGSEEPTRKQKFNSLTRMLRLSDKEDKSKSLGQYRGRSLTRILRRKVPIEGDNPPDKPDEHVRGIFSRILQQIRGRSSKTDSASGNSSQKNKEKSLSPSKSPSSSALSELNLDTSCPAINAHSQA